jgi:hypothetical protein
VFILKAVKKAGDLVLALLAGHTTGDVSIMPTSTITSAVRRA